MQRLVQVPRPKKHTQINKIGIFGSADVDEKHPLFEEVFSVTRYLAYHGKIIVDGGGPGVMLAATQGAASVGGKTVGVTFYPADMPEFEGRDTLNSVDREIKTANYIERMFTLMDESDAFVCFQGGTGTLSEWTTAWLLAHLYYGNHKPLILYGAFWREVMRVINDHFFIGQKEQHVYTVVDNEEQLIAALDAFERELELRERERSQ
ncbi:LOG family protein [Candidatus Woesebacteria bacterium]|nr:LOG family protein [Candidatus Woesebacteria bacterium]